jgi:hypothetical protein
MLVRQQREQQGPKLEQEAEGGGRVADREQQQEQREAASAHRTHPRLRR